MPGILDEQTGRFVRDPLSVQYDPIARELVSRCIRAYQRKGRNARAPAWVPFTIESALLSPRTIASNGTRISAEERAFQRSLYYDTRVHQWTQRPKPNARWSLQIDWGGVPFGPRRSGRAQVWRDTSGARHVETRLGTRESYVKRELGG